MNENRDKSGLDEDVDGDLDWLIQDSSAAEKVQESAATLQPDKERRNAANVQEEDTTKNDTTDEETDDDYEDVLTPDERKLLHRNTTLNDAEEGDEYDVKQRLEEANKALASEAAEDEEDRERRVAFKPGLVDFEVPPPESSSSDDEHEPGAVSSKMGRLDLNSSSGNTVEINGQFLRRDEKVLVERGGKFEFIEAGDLTSVLPAASHDEDQFHSQNKSTLPPVQQRPRSAPTKTLQTKLVSRPMSATLANQQLVNKSNTRTFSYSEETKKLIKKQAELRAKREAEEEKRRRSEEDLARREADEAWKAWVERKNDELKQQRLEEGQERRRQERMNRKDPEEAEDAYKSWLKQKMNQIRRERIMTQQQQIEYDEGWYLRERRDCNRAFRAWLRNKNEMARREKEAEVRLRKQSIREMRRARKAQRMMASIRAAQQMKYIEYYGYRV